LRVKCGEEYKTVAKTIEDFNTLSKELAIENPKPFDNYKEKELEAYLNVYYIVNH